MKSRNKPTQKRTRSLFLEPLESRVVLAGNVRAFVSGGTLNLDGDTRANEILIEQTANNQFVVSSRDGSTTINGQAGPLTFRGVSKSLDINMGNGTDVVEIAGSAGDVVRVRNRLFINTGSGADQVLLSEVHALGLHINTGSGRDLVNIGDDGAQSGIQVTKEAVILTGGGRDDARIANSLFKRFLTLDMGSDNDVATVQGSDFRKRSMLNGSSGSDTLNRDNNDGPLRFISWERTNKTVDSAPPLIVNAVDDTATITEDASPNTVTGNVLTNDVSPGTKTVTAVNGATGSVGQTINGQFGTFQINANGTFTYTLTNANATVNALNNGQTLTDSMSYTAGDGSTTDTATLQITIQGTTELSAVDDAGTVTEDASPNTTTGNVLTNDIGGAGTKTVTGVEGGTVGQVVNGQFGTFLINADGTFTYTLNNSNATVNALNSGQILTDEIDYTVTAGLATDTGTLTITIQGTTELAAVDDTGSVTEDATPNTATGNVLTNDTGGTGAKTVTGVEGGTVGQVVNGQFGTFLINADGTFTYTLNNSNATVNALNNGQPLTDEIDYTVTAGLATDTGTLTITIQGNTDILAVDDSGTVIEDASPNTNTGNVLTNDTGGTGTNNVTAVNGAAGSVGQVVNGQFGTFLINADGTYTYTLDNSNATVNALNNGQPLTDSIDYTVTSGTTTDTGTLTITIQGTTELNAVNDTGTVIEDASPNTATGNVLTNDEGGAGAKTVTAVEGGTVGQVVNGQFGTFLINADGTFTYTLDNNNPTVQALNNTDTLTDEIDYTVTAGLSTDTATLTITIQGTTELNAVNDTGTVTEDDTPATATGNVLTNDEGGAGAKTVTAVEGGTVGQVVNGQFGTFLINADGTFTYTLDNNNPTVQALNNSDTLIDEIDYTVTAGLSTDTATLTITINGHTELAAVNDTGSVTEDDPTNTSTGNVLTNDTGGSGTKTVTAVAGGTVGQVINGQFGTFVINADGSFTYTLDNNNAALADLNTGETLTDSIDYTVSDDVTSDIGTLTITINGNTDAGAVDATNDTDDVTEDATPNTATGSVLTNDTGSGTLTVTAVDGDPADVGQTIQGQFGTFVINADGTYTYTLDNNNAAVNDLDDGEPLTDSINYTAGNGTTTDIGTLTITINGHTELLAVNDTGSVTEDDPTNTSTGNVLDNDTPLAASKTVTAVAGVPGDVGQVVNGQFGTFVINSDGTFTYTLDNNNTTVNDLDDGEPLTDSIDYTVSDGIATSIATLTITITGATDI